MKKSITFIRGHKKLSLVLLLLADLVFFSLTDPSNSPVPIMAIGFVLLLLSIYVCCYIAIRVLSAFGYLERRKRWSVLAVTAFIFIVMALQAAGQLSTRDILALMPLVAISYFYYTYTIKQSD